MRLPPVWRAVDPRLLPLFMAIARTRSMTHAAAQLHISRSVASRQLARLEDDLGVRLVNRTTRRLSLTEIGAQVLQAAEHVERALEGVARLTSSYAKQIAGQLRISCTMALGRKYIAPAIPPLCAKFPQLEVSLLLDDRIVDLLAEDIDVAIRVSHLPDSSLVARKLVDNPRVLVAAPAYLRRHPALTSPEQLADHECVVWVQGSRTYNEWRLMGPTGSVTVHVHGQIRVNDGEALVRAAVAGAGVLNIDQMLLGAELETGALVQVLPGYVPEPGPAVYAIYPTRKHLPSKTATFVQFLEQHLRDTVGRQRPKPSTNRAANGRGTGRPARPT